MKDKIRTCKWYPVCPIKYFVDQGKLDEKWVNLYCLVGNEDCVRYQLEESGQYHPDNMLPNGEIKEDLHY
ncbi:MAG: uracil-DNA glycosylase [Promethearchaeota archaeon]